MSAFSSLAAGDSVRIGGAYSVSRPPTVGSRVLVDLYLVDLYHDSAPYHPLRSIPPRDRPRAEVRVEAVVLATYRTPGGCAVEVELEEAVDGGRRRFLVGPAEILTEPIGIVAVGPVVEPPWTADDERQFKHGQRVDRMFSREAATRVTLGSAPLAKRAECNP